MPLYSVSGIGEKPHSNSYGAQFISHNDMIFANCEDDAIEKFSRDFESENPGFSVRKVGVFQVSPPPDLSTWDSVYIIGRCHA